MSDPTTYIVLFRGVGGATQLPVARLRQALGEGGFGAVATYINSGNAVLDSPWDAAATRKRIAGIVAREFGFTKEIMLVGRADWRRVIAENPFPEAADQPTLLHVFVLAQAPRPDAFAALQDRARGESLHLRGNILYLHVPDGFSASKLPPVLDRTLGTTSTARNWRTVLALDRLAGAAR